MTASTFTTGPVSYSDATRQHGGDAPVGAPNFFRVWLSSSLVYFLPNRMGRLWTGVSLPRAWFIALVNCAIAPLWMVLVIASYEALDESLLRVTLIGDYVPHPFQKFAAILKSVPGQFYGFWSDHSEFDSFEHFAMVLAAAVVFFTGVAILFFVLLPIAARPGPNKPCVRHTFRAVLLSSGSVHVWSPIISAMFLLLMAERYLPNLENYILPVTVVLSVLTLWTLGALLIAVRQDYRSAASFPKPHDPWCEECGYNLLAADPAGRCPECGTVVARSVGPEVRPPTPWEERPTLFNLAAIRGQIGQLIRRPRELFFAMPTLQGQGAAHRWLLGSVIVVGILASCILPVGKFLRIFDIEWGWNLLMGSLAVGIVWAILALMMVGIETAGIATFSRLKARSNPDASGPRGVYLAAAAKVTAYSSTLMLPWVILGGAQLLGYEYIFSPHFAFHRPISMRTLQILLASSLSVAHIGGLLWYELTVYRGIRAIQYANK